MKVAVIQMASGPDKTKNILRAQTLAQTAIDHNAEFIAFPEYFNFRGPIRSLRDWKSIREMIPGESTQPFIDMARRDKVPMLLGSLYEFIPGSFRAYNTAVFIDEKGRIAGTYRKINLFKANINNKVIREAKIFRPGKKLCVVQVGRFKCGLSMCFDLRFSDIYAEYKKQGVHILCAPSSFSRITGEAHWEALVRARAIENLSYVIAPNQGGIDGRGVASYGNSMIVDPWGKILARASSCREEIIYADVSMEVVCAKRDHLPTVYRNR